MAQILVQSGRLKIHPLLASLGFILCLLFPWGISPKPLALLVLAVAPDAVDAVVVHLSRLGVSHRWPFTAFVVPSDAPGNALLEGRAAVVGTESSRVRPVDDTELLDAVLSALERPSLLADRSAMICMIATAPDPSSVALGSGAAFQPP